MEQVYSLSGRTVRNAARPQDDGGEGIMSKVRNSKSRKSAPLKDWPVVIYVSIFGLGISSYVAARAILYSQPHPYHWLASLLGGLAGIPIGWWWYRRRGDII